MNQANRCKAKDAVEERADALLHGAMQRDSPSQLR